MSDLSRGLIDQPKAETEAARKPSRALAIPAAALSGLGLLTQAAFYVVPFADTPALGASLLLSIAGIALSLAAMRSIKPKPSSGMAYAGLLMGVLGLAGLLVFRVLIPLLLALILIAFGTLLNS